MNKKGFTLVEVIVVAVIVAVLAAVAIPLYLGYITSSKANVANNTANACATYLAAARNSSSGTPTVTGFAASIAPGTVLSYTPTGGAAVTFTVPTLATLTTTGSLAAGGTVACTYDGTAGGNTYPY